MARHSAPNEPSDVRIAFTAPPADQNVRRSRYRHASTEGQPPTGLIIGAVDGRTGRHLAPTNGTAPASNGHASAASNGVTASNSTAPVSRRNGTAAPGIDPAATDPVRPVRDVADVRTAFVSGRGVDVDLMSTPPFTERPIGDSPAVSAFTGFATAPPVESPFGHLARSAPSLNGLFDAAPAVTDLNVTEAEAEAEDAHAVDADGVDADGVDTDGVDTEVVDAEVLDAEVVEPDLVDHHLNGANAISSPPAGAGIVDAEIVPDLTFADVTFPPPAVTSPAAPGRFAPWVIGAGPDQAPAASTPNGDLRPLIDVPPVALLDRPGRRARPGRVDVAPRLGSLDLSDEDLRILRPHRPGKGRLRLSGTAWLIGVAVVSILVAVAMRAFVVQSFWIPSGSMEPTLHGCSGCNNDRVLVDKLSYHLHSIDRGDVIVFSRPAGVPESDTYLIKRVIGLSGEQVSARDGSVVVDGRTLVESYLEPSCGGTQDFGPVTVPAGDVFVMGDNRCGSLDSRFFGPIKKSSVVGRAFIRIWPLSRLHWL